MFAFMHRIISVNPIYYMMCELDNDTRQQDQLQLQPIHEEGGLYIGSQCV